MLPESRQMAHNQLNYFGGIEGPELFPLLFTAIPIPTPAPAAPNPINKLRTKWEPPTAAVFVPTPFTSVFVMLVWIKGCGAALMAPTIPELVTVTVWPAATLTLCAWLPTLAAPAASSGVTRTIPEYTTTVVALGVTST